MWPFEKRLYKYYVFNPPKDITAYNLNLAQEFLNFPLGCLFLFVLNPREAHKLADQKWDELPNEIKKYFEVKERLE